MKSVPLIVIAAVFCLGFTPAASAQSGIFSNGFESGQPCLWSSVQPQIDCPPRFPGISLLAATGEGTVTVAWFPATDDLTPPDAVVYEIHLSSTPEFEPGPDSLAALIVGDTSGVLTGLTASRTYHFLVLARDGAGQRSSSRDYRTISTQAFPARLSGAPLLNAGDLNLGTPVTADASTLVFDEVDEVPGATLPAVGALLAGPLADGDGYLRKVRSVTVDGARVIVQTLPAALREAVEQLHLPIAGTLAVPATTADYSNSLAAPDFTMTGAVQDDASRSRRFEWGDGHLLSVERVDHAAHSGGWWMQPGEIPGTHDLETKDLDFGEVHLGLEVDFEPEFVTEAKWSPRGGMRSAELLARGTLTLDAVADYDFSGTGSIHPTPITLYTVTWRAFYFVGKIPVHQKVTLDVKAELSASATGAIRAVTAANATAVVEAGVRFNETNGWQPVASVDLTRSMTAKLDVLGNVEAEVRVIPELSVEFYKAVSGRLSVVPTLRGTIGAETTSAPACAPLSLTDFSFDLELDCFAGVDLSIFGGYTVYDGQVCDPPAWRLFDLPQISVDATGSGPVDLQAFAADGVNNPFDLSSATWSASEGQVVPDPGDPLRATLTCSSAGTPTATFSGFGVLGSLARRCVQVEAPCVPVDDYKEIAYISNASGFSEIWLVNDDGSAPSQLTDFRSGELFSPSWSPDGSRIAFASDKDNPSILELFVMNADGTNVQRLVNAAQVGNLRSAHPSWHPDGDKILFSTHAGCCSGGVWIVNDDGTGLTGPIYSGSYVGDADFSADGSKIVFSPRANASANSHQLWTMDADGSNRRIITPECCNEGTTTGRMDWGPHTERIVAILAQDILTMDPDGTNRTALTTGGSWPPSPYLYEHPSWSPDATRIVYTRATSSNSEIWTMDADGSNKTVLTLGGYCAHPSWR